MNAIELRIRLLIKERERKRDQRPYSMNYEHGKKKKMIPTLKIY
jgi:hypothetical protein